MPHLDQIEQHGHRQSRALRGPALEPGLEVREQGGVAGDQAPVEQRDQQLRIVGLELVEVGDLAHVLADGQAEVPQRLEQAADGALLGRGDRTAGDDQQIQVRVQAQRPAPIAADRGDDDRGRDAAQHLGREIAHEAVHLIGVVREHRPAGPALPRLGGVLVARGGETRLERGPKLTRAARIRGW